MLILTRLVLNFYSLTLRPCKNGSYYTVARLKNVQSYMLRALKNRNYFTYVEEYSFLLAPYIDLFNIDQYWYYLNYFVLTTCTGHTHLFLYINTCKLTLLYFKTTCSLTFFFNIANLPFFTLVKHAYFFMLTYLFRFLYYWYTFIQEFPFKS